MCFNITISKMFSLKLKNAIKFLPLSQYLFYVAFTFFPAWRGFSSRRPLMYKGNSVSTVCYIETEGSLESEKPIMLSTKDVKDSV